MKSSTPILLIHHAGDWTPAQVQTRWIGSGYQSNDETARVIEDEWIRATAEPNRKLFDGPMCRLESWAVADDRVDCGLSRTTYQTFWGTNISNPQWADQFGRQVMANPVGVSPALETADGFLLFGRRNARVAYYPSRVHPFAGALEPDDAEAQLQSSAQRPGPDLFAAIHRELAEELSLKAEDLQLIRLTGVVEDVNLRQPELIFRVRTRLDRRTIERQVSHDEHHHGIAIPTTPDELAKAMLDPAMTPVAMGSILLWGKLAIGDGWYREQLASGRVAEGNGN